MDQPGTGKKMPWYEDRSVLVSIAALMVSIITAILVQIESKDQSIRAKHEELRKLLVNLIDLREGASRFPQLAPEKREIASQFSQTKHAVYLEAAENLVGQIPRIVASQEYQVLAYENMSDSNFKKAEDHFLQAIHVGETQIAKATAMRSAGAFYFCQGPTRDFIKGRELFERSATVLKEARDDYSNYTTGYTFELWGFSELGNGFPKESEQRFEAARKYYSDMSEQNILKNWAFEGLSNRLAQAKIPTAKRLR